MLLRRSQFWRGYNKVKALAFATELPLLILLLPQIGYIVSSLITSDQRQTPATPAHPISRRTKRNYFRHLPGSPYLLTTYFVLRMVDNTIHCYELSWSVASVTYRSCQTHANDDVVLTWASSSPLHMRRLIISNVILGMVPSLK